MKPLFALALSFLLAGTAVAAAAEPVVMPFLFRNNHILFRGTVNDSDSLWFILDTGAMGNVLNRSTVDRLGLTVAEGAEAHGAGGRVAAGIVSGATIRLPGVELPATMLVAIPLDQVALKSGHPCDGVIGAPFFDRAVVEVDYARSRLVLHDPAATRPAGKGTTLPLTFDRNLPYVTARLTPPGGEPVEGRYVIDTGSTMSLILSPGFVTETKALERAPRTLKIQMGGVGGLSEQALGRVEKFELGPYALARPTAAFRAAGPGAIGEENSHGNIGGEVLRRFKVTFDYPRKQVTLEPAAAFNEPFEADMSGLVVSSADDAPHALRVVIVQEDSPAAERGVRVGDVLATVDGAPVTRSGLVDVRRRLREAGRTVRLGLVRGGEALDVTLTTRRLL
jgi:predicted aspartyl protease